MQLGLGTRLTKLAAGLRAALSLDFLTGRFDQRITFSRGSGGGAFGSDGLYKWYGYNLLLQSNTLNVTWATTNASVSAATDYPTGFTSAWTLTDDATSGAHTLTSNTAGASATTTYTLSFYAKAGTLPLLRVWLRGGSSGNRYQVYLNLANGTSSNAANVGLFTGGATSSVAIGNGWYRYSITATTGAGETAISTNIATALVAGTDSYAGTGQSAYVAGFQIEQASTASSYSPTTTAASGAPRFDYDPVTLASKGLLVEEQRTNLLLQSRDITNASWTKANATATRDQVGLDGVANSACKVVFTVATAQYVSQGISTTAGQVITVSFALKYSNQQWVYPLFYDTANRGAYVDLVNGELGNVDVGVTASITRQSGGFYRVALTYTTAFTGTSQAVIHGAKANGDLSSNINDAVIVDYAQLEVGAFATSPIPTTTASATRSADSASMTGTNFSSWYSQTQGTFVVEYQSPVAALRHVLTASDGSFSNQIDLNCNAINSSSTLVNRTGGSQIAIANDNTAITSAVRKTAAVYASADYAIVSNGGTVATSTAAGSLPTVNQLTIGKRGDNVEWLNGYVRRIQYYPTRLPNATLQALTA